MNWKLFKNSKSENLEKMRRKVYSRWYEKTWLDQEEIDVLEYVRPDLAYHLNIRNNYSGFIASVGLVKVTTEMDSKYKLGNPKKNVKVRAVYHPLKVCALDTYKIMPIRTEEIEIEVSTETKRRFGFLKTKFIKLVTKRERIK